MSSLADRVAQEEAEVQQLVRVERNQWGDPSRYVIGFGYYQGRILQDNHRNQLLVAGRRFGKTTKIAGKQLRKATRRWDQLIWYVAPTYKMAKEIYWERLKRVVPREWLKGKPNESDLMCRLKNNSVIQLKGADNPDALRGPGLDGADFDEYAMMKPNVYDIVRPALADKNGYAGFYGTPAGFNHFYDLFQRGVPHDTVPGWASFRFTTLQGGRVPRHELAAAREELDTRVFRQEFEASFETLKGRVYHAYSRDGWPVGNDDAALLDRGGELYVGMDFNVNPMSAVVVQKHFTQPQVLDEIELMTSNTQEMADEIKARYPGRRIIVCPDASGDANKTSAPMGETDFTILKRAGFEVLADRANPRVVDRHNNTNSNLCTASGLRRLRMRPHCKKLRKSLEGLVYKEGTSLVDKSSGLDHMGDALGYVLWQVFNVYERVQKLVAPEEVGVFNPYVV